jgi:hypothetical protein
MDKPIREGIEACRPASADLLSPDMTEVARQVQDDPQARLVYERVQQWDTAIGQSIDEVSVPPGLAERILERLRIAAGASTGRSANLVSETIAAAANGHHLTGDVQLAPPPARAPWSRRRWTGATVSALLACALVVAVGSWLRQDRDLALDQLADQWKAQLGSKWQPFAQAPRDFAPPSAIQVPPARWQWIDRYTTVPVVAYELIHNKAGKAMLYVAKMTRGDVEGAPPDAPYTTAGKTIACWQSGSHFYMLVFENERSYRAFVKIATTPFA